MPEMSEPHKVRPSNRLWIPCYYGYMIKSVKEVHVGTVAQGADGLLYWTYMICGVPTNRRRKRYNLIRIDNVCENMERLGCELPLKDCRRLIRDYENGNR
jgi:hypothetical protein